MVRPLLRLIITRGLLMAAPFVIWFIWRAWARRTGREMGATPWPWLFAAGCVLVALSLLTSVAFRPDNRGGTYVPGQVRPDGSVSPGYFQGPPEATP